MRSSNFFWYMKKHFWSVLHFKNVNILFNRQFCMIEPMNQCILYYRNRRLVDNRDVASWESYIDMWIWTRWSIFYHYFNEAMQTLLTRNADFYICYSDADPFEMVMLTLLMLTYVIYMYIRWSCIAYKYVHSMWHNCCLWEGWHGF